MGLIQTIRGVFGRKSGAVASFAALAAKAASGALDDKDAESLQDVLAALNKTPADFEAAVSIHCEAARLRALASTREAAQSQVEKTARAFQAGKVHVEAEILRLREELYALNDAQRTAAAALHAAERATLQLDILEYENAEVLGIAAKNLDEVTPTSGGAAVHVLDPDAPRVEVPVVIFKRESAKRHALQEAFDDQCEADYQEALKKWQIACSKTSPNKFPPVPVRSHIRPTWSALRRMGLNPKIPRTFVPSLA